MGIELFWTPGSSFGDDGAHDVSSDISSLWAVTSPLSTALNLNKVNCTTKASNSTVCSRWTLPGLGMVPQVGGSQEPWRSKASQEMETGKWGFKFSLFHFGRAAIQHEIRLCKKKHRWIFIAEHLVTNPVSWELEYYNRDPWDAPWIWEWITESSLVKKGIAYQLHVSFFQRPIHGIPIWQCGETCKWENLKSSFHHTSHTILCIYIYLYTHKSTLYSLGGRCFCQILHPHKTNSKHPEKMLGCQAQKRRGNDALPTTICWQCIPFPSRSKGRLFFHHSRKPYHGPENTTKEERRKLLEGSTVVFFTAGYAGKRFIYERAMQLGVKSVAWL